MRDARSSMVGRRAAWGGLLAALAAAPARADDVLALAAYLAEVRDRNPTVRHARALARAAEGAAQAAGGLEDPMLELSLWNAPVDFSMAPVMLELSQGIPLFGKLGARRAAADAEAGAAARDVAARERDVLLAAHEAFAAYFLNRRSTTLLLELTKLAEHIAAAAQAQYLAGRVGQSDVLRARVELARQANDLITLEEQERAIRVRLNALADRPPDRPPGTPAIDRLRVVDAADEALRGRALEARDEVAAAALRLAGARAELDRARAAYAPDITVRVAYMKNFGSPMPDNFFAGAMVNVPLVFGDRLHGGERAAVERVAAAEEALRAARLAAVQEVQTALQRLRSAYRHVKLHAEVLIPLTRQALAAAQAAYVAGQADMTALVAAVADVKGHEVELARWVAEHEVAYAALERAAASDLGPVSREEPVHHHPGP